MAVVERVEEGKQVKEEEEVAAWAVVAAVGERREVDPEDADAGCHR